MRLATLLRIMGVGVLVFVVHGLAFGGFSRGEAGIGTVTFFLSTLAGVTAIALVVGADWFADRAWDRPTSSSLSLARHQRNRRERARVFKVYVRAGGSLPEPPGGVGHDPDVLAAWVAGDYDRTERLVEMRTQEAARLSEDGPEAARAAHYREIWEAASAAVENSASLDPRTASILDESE